MPVELYSKEPLVAYPPSGSCRVIYGDPTGSRTTPVLMEWELTAGEFSDEHPHDEFNVVIEGELHVDSDGSTVVARVGDTVRVAAGSVGTYRAPQYARMLLVYDHNPAGLPTVVHGNRSLVSPGEPH